ncbi:MAG: antibiotic biosynthesis monooxygenase [Eudoraea sp.]|nr:antibiotic biosynthesis monooxygenase [Eudoraea sp.]
MKTLSKISAATALVVTSFLLLGFIADNKQFDSTPEGNNIVVLVKYKAQPDKGADAVSELTKLIEQVQKEPHFMYIKLHVDPEDDTNILLYEEWDDESYYKSEHMNTTHLQEFIAKSRNFLAGPPEISFWKTAREFKP